MWANHVLKWSKHFWHTSQSYLNQIRHCIRICTVLYWTTTTITKQCSTYSSSDNTLFNNSNKFRPASSIGRWFVFIMHLHSNVHILFMSSILLCCNFRENIWKVQSVKTKHQPENKDIVELIDYYVIACFTQYSR